MNSSLADHLLGVDSVGGVACPIQQPSWLQQRPSRLLDRDCTRRCGWFDTCRLLQDARSHVYVHLHRSARPSLDHAWSVCFCSPSELYGHHHVRGGHRHSSRKPRFLAERVWYAHNSVGHIPCPRLVVVHGNCVSLCHVQDEG